MESRFSVVMMIEKTVNLNAWRLTMGTNWFDEWLDDMLGLDH